jgi:uncharacterized membrane protein YkvA (DUF1232 family)
MDKDYIGFLKDKFQQFKDSGEVIDEDLSHFPDLVKLSCDMLDEDIVDRDSRLMICASLGYLLVPNDALPEDVYGIDGYMDDLYIVCITLDGMKKKYPDTIAKLWDDDTNLDELLASCISKGEKMLEEKNLKERLLTYCGFAD